MDNINNSNTNSTNSNSTTSNNNKQISLIINGKDKRAILLAELEKWNSAEQIKFLVDSMKFLSFNLIKFISAICNDLIDKQTINKISKLNNSSTSSSNDFSTSSTDINHTQQYTNILEEQANDILYFRVLSEKPIESKLKIIVSYLPLLKIQTHNYELNESLRKLYNEQIHDIFTYCIKNKQYFIECYELSLIASLHPIFEDSQQLNFKTWTHIFECSLTNFNDPLLPTWLNHIKLISKIPNLFYSAYSNTENLLKDSNYYSLQSDENQSSGNGDNLSDYKLTNFDNDLIHSNDFNIDSATTSLNLSLHMQTSQSGGNNNNNNCNAKNNLEITNNSAYNNDSIAESSSTSSSSSSNRAINNNNNNSNSSKSLLTRQHMPLKLSISLPPQQTSSSTSNHNSYSRGFNSLNHYEDINSSASSMNSFTFNNNSSNINNNSLKNDHLSSSNNIRDNQNYSLNSYSDFDYLNLENLIIPPLSSSSSSVQSIVSSQLAGSSITSKSVNDKQEIKKELKENGIKNVTQWLKHLRLHKYTDYFSSLNYEEILALNDDKLIESKITLGARKKILTNIEKLRNRPERIRELINIMNDDKCPLNLFTLENILNELTEMSITPMKQQNSPPTSLALLNSKVPISNEIDSNNLSQLFIDLLDKIQKFLLKQKAESKDEAEILKQKELTLTYVKIIDKLFLTKAFSDVQNSHMAKLRNSVYDKNQIGKLDAANNTGKSYRNRNLNSYNQDNSNNHLNHNNKLNTNQNVNNIFQPYQLNEKSLNPLQRIKQRTLNVRCLTKTTSLPFADNQMSNQNQHFQHQSQQNRLLNYSNKIN